MAKIIGDSSKRRRSRRKRGATRDALIETAFTLLGDNRSFDGLSLRELTREVGIVPASFYRHFPQMDAFGLALVEAAFTAFRQVIADLRAASVPSSKMIRGLTETMMKSVEAHQLQVRFIAAERYGGNAGVRNAIRQELRLIEGEVALEMGRMPIAQSWTSDDLRMLAMLYINTMVSMAEEVLSQPDGDGAASKRLLLTTEKQLRLIALGARNWNAEA